jgi:hypothetical protein
MPAERTVRDPTGGLATEARAALADVVLTLRNAGPPLRSKGARNGSPRSGGGAMLEVQ